MAAALLRDLGAAVVKIEPPAGDPLAAASAAWYADLCRGIDVVQADLKIDAARRLLDERLAAADLLLTSSRPAALARLGLDWTDLHARHPRLCMVRIVGHAPPRDSLAGHDLTYQAAAGLLAPPSLPRTLIADLAGAQQAVIAALALLFARDRDGAGCADVSLGDAAALFAEPVRRGLTVEGGALGGGLPQYNIYRARDGWVAVAALEPHFLNALAAALGTSSLDRQALERTLAERPAAEWQAWAEQHDLPLVKVQS